MHPPNEPTPSTAPQSKLEVPGKDLAVTQPGEVTIFKIKHHPIGIMLIYTGITLVLAALAALAFAILPELDNTVGSSDGAVALGTVGFVILSLICIIYAYIVTHIYWGNSWILTSDSITQIEQTSLFHSQSSQLSLEHIEDVGAVQSGVLSHVFNYGILKVETAGEQGRFHFTYCPNPRYYAQKILATREAFMLHEQYQQATNHGTAPQHHTPPTS